MSKKTRLKIGEFSKLMQVTVKTLRHYEQKRLLIQRFLQKNWYVSHAGKIIQENRLIRYTNLTDREIRTE